MEICTILVNLDIDHYSPGLLTAAVDLAQRFNAKISAVAAGQAPLTVVGVQGGAVATGLYEADRAAIESRLTGLEFEFNEAVPAPLRGSCLTMFDSPNRVLVAAARRSDLILVDPWPGGDQEASRNVDVGALLLSAGRPVLVAARDAAVITANRIVVGWKDTRETRRAVTDALPFLKSAEEVVVAAIEEKDRSFTKAEVGDIVGWMQRHGVKAHGDVYPRTGTVAASLESIAREVKADLIVAGAYGHSRTREWLFGGVTRDLIGSVTISRFMSN